MAKHLLVKILVFIVNIVLWACGILLIVFGSIALATPVTIVNLLDLIPGVAVVTAVYDVTPLFEGVAIFMIVLGSLLFLFGGIGCCGAFKMHKRMIMNYWIMLILGVLTEIALIVYAAVFPNTMNDSVQSGLNTSLIQNFAPVTIESNGTVIYNPVSTKAAWEELQSQSHCCGALSYMDYATFAWQGNSYAGAVIPPTCCASTLPLGQNISNTKQLVEYPSCLTLAGIVANNYYTQGCWNPVINMIWQFDYIAIIISSCLMATQILGIILTVHTWHKMFREDGRV